MGGKVEWITRTWRGGKKRETNEAAKVCSRKERSKKKSPLRARSTGRELKSTKSARDRKAARWLQANRWGREEESKPLTTVQDRQERFTSRASRKTRKPVASRFYQSKFGHVRRGSVPITPHEKNPRSIHPIHPPLPPTPHQLPEEAVKVGGGRGWGDDGINPFFTIPPLPWKDT